MAKKPKLFAAVVLGTQNVYLKIVEQRNLKEVEDTHYPVDIGSDIFSEKFIQGQTVKEIFEAIQAVINLMKDYDVTDYHFFANQGFREAVNSEFVKEQIQEKFDVKVDWISLSQESLYREQSINTYMKNFPELTKPGALLIDISAGSVELIFYKDSEFVFSRNLKLGPLRIYEDIYPLKLRASDYVKVLKDYVNSKVIDFIRLLPQVGEIKNIVVMGSEISILDSIFNGGKAGNMEIKTKKFKDMYKEIAYSPDGYLMDRFNITADKVTQTMPIMVLIKRFLDYFKTKSLWVTDSELVDGIAVNAVQAPKNSLISKQRHSQITVAAHNLAERYHVDEEHQNFIIQYSLKIFDRLKKAQNLDKDDRTLLEVSAIVADIGKFVNSYHHSVNSAYIIKHSDILGLSVDELKCVAGIVRNASLDTPFHDNVDVPSDARIKVAKLAAILRMATSLDASHEQKVQSLKISLTKSNHIVFQVTSDDDIELERWRFEQKGRFFESVFGLKPELKGRITL